MSNKEKEYKAQAIKVLEGLEAVRKRPAMYIGSTGPQGLHHLVYEVVDNSVDEALGGHCDTIQVTLNEDGSCTVEDNGRGIPTDIHPTEGVSAAEVVFTKLHAGGKFDKDSYKFSGGLHGVGISVVNALSEWVKLRIYQDGKIFEQEYQRGKPLGRLQMVGDTKKRGTVVRFKPDPEIFTETTDFSFDTLSARLRELAFLNKKLRITITDEINNKDHEFYFEGGIVSFVEYINKKKQPLFPEVVSFSHEDDKYMVDIAMQYNDGYGEQLYSFVNNINTIEGGTHVSGFKGALTKLCNKKAQELNILKGESFSSDDVREGLVCVISIKVPEPQFEGQTKTKLGNNEVKGVVESWTSSFLDTFFEENPSIARKILQKAEIAKRAREAAKKARELTRRKTVMESTILPGKLADCSNENPAETELFIVEGDSAGGSAKQARDRMNQAILPLKGKILNVEKARIDRILSNDEIKALTTAVGAGIGDDFDASRARYHKIILMTDADVDGSHIRTLLLTFFFRYMRELIERGYLYIAQPPLFKAKIGRKEQYLKDERSLKQFLYDWASENTDIQVDGGKMNTSDWQQLLKQLYSYDELLHQISPRFAIASHHCHQLVAALAHEPWHKNEPVETLINIIQPYFKNWKITVDKPTTQEAEEEVADQETIPQQSLLFSMMNVSWRLPVSFFGSQEIGNLTKKYQTIEHLKDKAWRLEITNRDRFIEGDSILSLLDDVTQISKPYLNIQRYKGLGEMNPDQLWETAMDSTTRTLLQVSIEDGLEADNWFTTLMGDDVKGRRDYIEKFGQFAKNLDV